MKKRLTTLFTLTLLLTNFAYANGDNPDFFRSIGKIYVVVAVIITIFVGIVLFLVYLERKLSKLENLTNYKDNE